MTNRFEPLADSEDFSSTEDVDSADAEESTGNSQTVGNTRTTAEVTATESEIQAALDNSTINSADFSRVENTFLDNHILLDSGATDHTIIHNNYHDQGSLEIMLTMPTQTEAKDLDSELHEKWKSPIQEPINLANLTSFRNVLGGVLMRFESDKYDAGFSWIVDTEAKLRERTGYDDEVLPPTPRRPREPNGEQTALAWRKYYLDLDHYKQYSTYNKAVLKAIERRYPKQLTSRQDSEGNLPINFTARQAFELLEEKVSSEEELNKAYVNLQNRISTRRYVPAANQQGFYDFAQAMKTDKASVDIVNRGRVSWEELIIYTQIALGRVLSGSDIRKMNEKWRETTDQGSNIKLWNNFVDFYARKLKLLEEDDKKYSKVANAVEHQYLERAHAAINDRLDEIESRVESRVSQEINHAYRASGIPSVIGTTADTPSYPPSHLAFSTQAGQIQTQIDQSVQASLRPYLAKLDALTACSTSVTPTTSSAPTAKKNEWKQWKHWCWSHGPHISHSSANCPRPKTGHISTATQSNPMGGGVPHRERLWMKWCHPVDYSAHDTPGGPITK